MIKPLFWICGNRRQSVQAWQKIYDHVKQSTGEEPKVEVVFCGPNPKDAPPSRKWATALDLIGSLRTPDLFDARPRIFKIHGLPEDYTEIAEWLQYIKGKNIVVFCGEFGYTKPGSKQWVSGKNSKLFKAIKSDGKVLEFPYEASTEIDAVAWIREIATENKKEIDGATARRIVQLQGLNLDLLENSVIKLATYQKSKSITVEDVEACCFSDYQDEIWPFLDHLDFKRTEEALLYVDRFFAEGKGDVGDSLYGRMMGLFGALLQHFQFLMIVKDVCPKKIDSQPVLKVIEHFKKINPTKVSELQDGKLTLADLENRFSPKYVERNVRSEAVVFACQQRKSQVYTLLSDLYDCAHWARKYSSNPSLLRLCLDLFVLTCCGKMTSEEARAIRGGKGTKYARN